MIIDKNNNIWGLLDVEIEHFLLYCPGFYEQTKTNLIIVSTITHCFERVYMFDLLVKSLTRDKITPLKT